MQNPSDVISTSGPVKVVSSYEFKMLADDSTNTGLFANSPNES